MQCQFVRRMPEMVRNLNNLYQKATIADIQSGIAWYPTAHRIVCEWADHYERPIANVACIIAAISPQCSWERNLLIAENVLEGSPASIGGCLRTNLNKARQIAYDYGIDITHYFPHGPKVASFACNLAGDYSVVTIDTHAMQAALNDVKADYRLRWIPYAIFAECYKRAAHQVSREPSEFQAILWYTWKRLYPTDNKRRIRGQYFVNVEMED